MIVKPAPAPADPSKVCKTCGLYDPDVHVCCADDCLISEEESKLWTCGSWEPRKEKLNVFSVRETIGMDPVNPVEVPLQPEAKVKSEKQLVFGGTSLKGLEGKQKELEKVLHIESDMPEIQNERAKALDRGAKQGMTLEALETVFAIACQQVPSMEKRWMELKAEINIMFAQKWVAEDTQE